MAIEKTSAISFQAKFLSTPALKDIKAYAAANNAENELNQAFEAISKATKRLFHIKHRFLKTDNLVKTEFSWVGEDAKKKIYVATTDKIKNPAEATYELILKLADKTSRIYRDIFNK